MERTDAPTLAGLPTELQWQVCSNLDKKDLLSLRSVSKQFVASTASELFRRIPLSVLKVFLTREGLKTFSGLCEFPDFVRALDGSELYFYGGIADFLEDWKNDGWKNGGWKTDVWGKDKWRRDHREGWIIDGWLRWNQARKVIFESMVKEQKDFEREQSEAVQLVIKALEQFRRNGIKVDIKVGTPLPKLQGEPIIGMQSLLNKVDESYKKRLSRPRWVSNGDRFQDLYQEVSIPLQVLRKSDFSEKIVELEINPAHTSIQKLPSNSDAWKILDRVRKLNLRITDNHYHKEAWGEAWERIIPVIQAASECEEILIGGCGVPKQWRSSSSSFRADDLCSYVRQNCSGCQHIVKALNATSFTALTWLSLELLPMNEEVISGIIRSNHSTLSRISIKEVELVSGCWRGVVQAMRTAIHLDSLRLEGLRQGVQHATSFSRDMFNDYRVGIWNRENIQRYLDSLISKFEALIMHSGVSYSGFTQYSVLVKLKVGDNSSWFST
ncbi:hypothetical protein CC80DRAFT_549474 [Byssothecium circinans]|uniref:F-box domain-containing protein n=1 Tax=Byssothecium circinans TaxID=147558 RepID=A0A6A5TU43_9PLEO|nr:hypothetical protein CC80DRAFT_549474 [Byssothecium circinans]